MRKSSLIFASLLFTTGCDKDDVSGDTGPSATDSGDGDGDGFTEVQIGEPTFDVHDDIESLVYVTWNQREPCTAWVEYEVDTGAWLSSPATEVEVGDVTELLLGIPYDSDFSYRIANDFGAGPLYSDLFDAENGELPSDFPDIEFYSYDEDNALPGAPFLLGSINANSGGWTGGNYWLFIVNREADVVWAQLTPNNHWTIYARIAVNGVDILYDEATYWSDWDGGGGSQVHRIKIDGTVVESVSTPGLHHAFTELPDESLVYGSHYSSDETLDKRTPSGGYETIWNTRDYGWSHDESNSLWWYEEGDTFLYSFYTNDTVVEVDHQTGEVLREWGNESRSYSFDPSDSQFWWQHGVTYTAPDTVLLSTYTNSRETMAREYLVHDDTETLEEIWSFGEGEGVLANTAGEAHRLSNGNTLHNYGSNGRVREVTHEGDIVWDWEFPGERLIGRTVFIEDLYVFKP